jgi:hypothetical protein
MFFFQGANLVPGFQTMLETTENQFWIGRWENQIWHYGEISSAAVDAGNTNGTTTLRAGLLLGQVSATGELKQWNPAESDGTQNIYGVLGVTQPLRYGAGSSTSNRLVGMIHIAGRLDPAKLIVPGQTTLGISGNASEYDIRNQLGTRVLFGDALQTLPVSTWKGPVAKTSASVTVAESDNYTLFTNEGASNAVNFTLPATAKKGLRYGFYVVADQNVTVTAGTADTMVVLNDAAADSVALQTSSEKIGGFFEVMGTGTKWLVLPRLWEAQTVTIVTA